MGGGGASVRQSGARRIEDRPVLRGNRPFVEHPHPGRGLLSGAPLRVLAHVTIVGGGWPLNKHTQLQRNVETLAKCVCQMYSHPPPWETVTTNRRVQRSKTGPMRQVSKYGDRGQLLGDGGQMEKVLDLSADITLQKRFSCTLVIKNLKNVRFFCNPGNGLLNKKTF